YLRQNNLNRSKVGNKEVLLISGEKERFTGPKIFLRQTASEFIVNYDTQGFFGLRNLHTIHNLQSPYSPYLIMGILTSTLGNWLGKELNIIRTTGTDGNRYPQIRIRDMNNFPIISLDRDSNSSNAHKIRQLEVKIQENIQIGVKISLNYEKIWNLVNSHTEENPFSSQKRLFQYCKRPEKFSFLPNNTKTDLSFLLKDLKRSLSILEHNQVVTNEIVFKIYGISPDQWGSLF
ncbi:MAG: TaqI-like C-terminal specificity domain-containing protein, partial [Candidatus Hodarchaeales archaeon]